MRWGLKFSYRSNSATLAHWNCQLPLWTLTYSHQHQPFGHPCSGVVWKNTVWITLTWDANVFLMRAHFQFVVHRCPLEATPAELFFLILLKLWSVPNSHGGISALWFNTAEVQDVTQMAESNTWQVNNGKLLWRELEWKITPPTPQVFFFFFLLWLWLLA